MISSCISNMKGPKSPKKDKHFFCLVDFYSGGSGCWESWEIHQMFQYLQEKNNSLSCAWKGAMFPWFDDPRKVPRERQNRSSITHQTTEFCSWKYLMLKCTLVLILFETSKNMLFTVQHMLDAESLRMVSTTMIAAASPKRNFEWFEERCGSGRRRYRQRFHPFSSSGWGFRYERTKAIRHETSDPARPTKNWSQSNSLCGFWFLLPPCYTWPRITGWLADNDLHPDSRPDQFSLSLYILVHGDHGQCFLSTWRCPKYMIMTTHV